MVAGAVDVIIWIAIVVTVTFLKCCTEYKMVVATIMVTIVTVETIVVTVAVTVAAIIHCASVILKNFAIIA